MKAGRVEPVQPDLLVHQEISVSRLTMVSSLRDVDGMLRALGTTPEGVSACSRGLVPEGHAPGPRT